MKYHVFKKEFCPAKDSVCKDCQNKGHWAKSVMCPKFSKPVYQNVDRDKKVDDESSKPRLATKPTLKVISADQGPPTTSHASVNAITIPSRNAWLILAPILTVLVMIGLLALTPLSGHTIWNVV